MKILAPSSSYQILLPDDIQDQTDGAVSSFWIKDEPLLLQTSSYARETGRQVNAEERLQDRMSKHSENWRLWKQRVSGDLAVDEAVGEYVDRNGVRWIHAYLVWPHLTIYATVSGPADQTRIENNWALQSLSGIAPASILQ
jgi:hypothetical protein